MMPLRSRSLRREHVIALMMRGFGRFMSPRPGHRAFPFLSNNLRISFVLSGQGRFEEVKKSKR